jgi:hypothetical protein
VKLYRETHRTFESYTTARWDYSRMHAWRLIEAYKTAMQMLPTGNIPRNERAARPLVGMTPEFQRQVFEKAREAAGGKSPSGGQVQEAARAALGQLPPEVQARVMNQAPQVRAARSSTPPAAAAKRLAAADTHCRLFVKGYLRSSKTLEEALDAVKVAWSEPVKEN